MKETITLDLYIIHFKTLLSTEAEIKYILNELKLY